MMQVWFLFKIIETILGTCCMVYHALGFLNKDPIPHILLFCGTFFGFSLLAFMGVIGIVVGATAPALIECVVNLCAAVMYIIASIVSMHYAENDFHLMYLSDFEEPLHPFFAYCRAQSICALATGSVHLLHAILAIDVLFIGPPQGSADNSSTDTDSETAVSDTGRPIKMYFLSKFVESKLRRYQWFDRLCRRRNPDLSIFAFNRHSDLFSSQRFSGDDKSRMNRRVSHKGPPPPPLKPKSEDGSSDLEKELRSPLNYRNYPSSDIVGLKDERSKNRTSQISSASDAALNKGRDGSKLAARFTGLPSGAEEQPSTSTLAPKLDTTDDIKPMFGKEISEESKNPQLRKPPEKIESSEKEYDYRIKPEDTKPLDNKLMPQKEADKASTNVQSRRPLEPIESSDKDYDYRLKPEDTKVFDYQQKFNETASEASVNVVKQEEKPISKQNIATSEEPIVRIKTRSGKSTIDKEQQTNIPYVDSDDSEADGERRSANDHYQTAESFQDQPNIPQQKKPPTPRPPPPPQ